MPLYQITAPNGKTYRIEGPPGASDAEVAQAVLAQFPDAATPRPETTLLGGAKELVKGLVPGAVGLVEQAAIGASALLPERYETPAREAIAKVAGAVKAPFAAAPGYEESVPRKLSEAVGSTGPFLLAGPLGLAGRLGAAALGVGAGAGEARTRAEKEGATAEQRATATALGIGPGALEVFAPFRILSRIPDAATAQGVQLVKRALIAGGEEAAQEAASNFAQNLIAKGVYKPEQELIEGLGEQAAYGGATGAIVQGLMDLALGRRARGAAAPAAAGETPIERAAREEAAKAAVATPAPPAPPAAETPAPPAAETPAPPAAETPAPPAAETPAPPVAEVPPAPAAPVVEEPVVRKKDEVPPLPETLDSETIKKIGFVKGKIHDALVGKAATDPEIRAVLEEYKQRPTANAKTVAKIDAFLARLPEPVVPPPETPAAEAVPPMPTAPSVPTETPSVATTPTEPEAGGAGAPVVGGPTAVTAPEGVGTAEPTGVVPTVTDAGEPAAREGAEPSAVTPAAPEAPAQPAVPTFTEAEIDDALAANLITSEQAERARSELQTEEAPPTAMGQAFQKQIDGIKTQMDALRQKNGKPPAPKSKKRAEYDALAAQLDTLLPPGTGTLEERLEKAQATGVFTAAGSKPVVDLDALRDALTKARAEPSMLKAVLTYIGVNEDGTYLPTTYTADEAAESVGLKRSSGANVRRIANQLGLTADVISRFHAGQTDILVTGKDVSEAGTGLTDVQPRRGVLYEEPKKGESAKVVTFLRPALTDDGKLDFAKLTDRQVAEMYARASNFDPKRETNINVIKQLNAEIDARTQADRKSMQQALDSAYRVVRTEEEAAAEEAETPELSEEAEVEDKTRRLSDEEVEYRSIPQSPVVTNRASHAELEKVVSDIEKTLGGEVAVTILDDVTDVDAKQKPGSRAGATIKGGIYLFRSGIAKGIEGQKTVFHELFHKGLKNLLPEAEYRAMMNKFYNQSADIRAMADAYLASEVGKQDTEGFSPQDARTLAVEESLAEVAEQTKLKPTTIRQVGNFLARVADRLGMPQLARAIRTMGLNEQEKFIRDALQAGLGPSKPGEGVTRFRTAVTPEAEAAAAEVDAIADKEKPTFTQKVGRELAGNKALRLREKFTDSLAPLEDFFVNAYGGQVRTAGGRLNPMVLLSRALDALRVSKAAQAEGGLGRQDGLIVATELKNDKGEAVSYQGVLKRIADAAKAEGKSYEEYRKTIDNILYGHREYNLRETNKTLPTDERVLLLLNDAQIDRAEAAFQQDEFIKQVSADLDTIRFNLLDTLVETGRISPEQAKDYKDAIGYIPFERIGDYENAWSGATRGANRGVAALKKMRSLEGSDRKSASVVENFSGLMDWATKEAMKNEAALRALEDMTLMGMAKKVPSAEAIAKDAPGGVVSIYKEGKPVSFYVPDPAHLVAFSIADPQLSSILKSMQKGSQILRAGVTAMPPFAVKQIFDDVIRAYTYAGVKNNGELVKNVLTNFPKNWFNEVFKRKSDSVRELERLGIVGTFDFTQQTNLKNILEGAGAKKEGLGSSILRVMEAGAKASDLAVREAIYKQVMKETGDKAQAESAAREIINFSRRGSSKFMGQMISIIPFFNAYARGMDKLATAAAGKVVGQTTGTARSMFYKRMSVLTAMGLAYALMMQDDEEYNKLPDHVRDTNWILPYGKELGFVPGIPIPPELAFFFKAIPERIVRYYKYQGTPEERTAMDVLGELTKRGIDVFSSPNVTPQVLRPFIENMMNYSWFLGRPLESQAQLALRPFERYGTGTSDTMKAIARGLEDIANATGIESFAVSPIKLENAIRGLMGTAAGLGLSVTDAVINPSKTDRPLHQQLVPQLTGASALMKSAVGTRYMDEIYDLEKRTEQVNGTYNRMQKTDPAGADQFIKDNIGMYAIRDSVQSVMGAIRTLNDAAMTIDRDTSLSSEERRKRIDELRAEQNEIARIVFSLRKQARDIQAGR